VEKVGRIGDRTKGSQTEGKNDHKSLVFNLFFYFIKNRAFVEIIFLFGKKMACESRLNYERKSKRQGQLFSFII